MESITIKFGTADVALTVVPEQWENLGSKDIWNPPTPTTFTIMLYLDNQITIPFHNCSGDDVIGFVYILEDAKEKMTASSIFNHWYMIVSDKKRGK
jgi:hypothetical protein